MINYELLKDVLTMAILNSLIITSLVQRIKDMYNCLVYNVFNNRYIIFFKFLQFEVFPFIME